MCLWGNRCGGEGGSAALENWRPLVGSHSMKCGRKFHASPSSCIYNTNFTHYCHCGEGSPCRQEKSSNIICCHRPAHCNSASKFYVKNQCRYSTHRSSQLSSKMAAALSGNDSNNPALSMYIRQISPPHH